MIGYVKYIYKEINKNRYKISSIFRANRNYFNMDIIFR